MRTKGSRPGDGELVVQKEAELCGHEQTSAEQEHGAVELLRVAEICC